MQNLGDLGASGVGGQNS